MRRERDQDQPVAGCGRARQVTASRRFETTQLTALGHLWPLRELGSQLGRELVSIDLIAPVTARQGLLVEDHARKPRRLQIGTNKDSLRVSTQLALTPRAEAHLPESRTAEPLKARVLWVLARIQVYSIVLVRVALVNAVDPGEPDCLEIHPADSRRLREDT